MKGLDNHDLQAILNDPHFSQMDFVACRNLLIYIQPLLQKKIIPILHNALKPTRFLVLGGSESVSAFPDLVSTVHKKHKIYAKKFNSSRLHYDFAQTYYPSGGGADLPTKSREFQASHNRELGVEVAADRLVLRDHAPVGVVINNAMDVVQYRGYTTPFLGPAPGIPTVNV